MRALGLEAFHPGLTPLDLLSVAEQLRDTHPEDADEAREFASTLADIQLLPSTREQL